MADKELRTIPSPGFFRGDAGAVRTWQVIALAALIPALVACGYLAYHLYRRQTEPEPEARLARVEKPAPRPAIRERRVFESPLAGQWYPADADSLRSMIKGFVEDADCEPLDDVAALIMPHAGYRYSGRTAAYGLRTLEGGDYDRVIVMGPSHRVSMPNRASVPGDYTHYSTPLGEVPLDTAFMDALLGHPGFVNNPEAHSGEHSVQIELPMLQYVLDEFRLVPIVMGQIDADTAGSIGDVLLSLVDRRTLVVASSDFTHYGRRFGYVPFQDDVAGNLRDLDMGAWKVIEAGDLNGFFDYVDETGATICGKCPIGVLLSMLPDDARGRLLRYDTSGEMMNDFSNSVSYVCAVFTCTWPKGGRQIMARIANDIGPEDKKALLELARKTLTWRLEKGRVPSPDDLGIAITPAMEQVMGAFVTLHKHGELRGCIGEIFPRRPLYQAVMDHAINAGLNDPRFPPVTVDELPELDFEISALTPPEPVGSYEEIKLGRHGVVLERGPARAVFLPQVAPEQGWDLPETLSHLAMKAGLPPDGWREHASFTVFEAIVFGEKERG